MLVPNILKVSPEFIEEAKALCEKQFALTFGPRLVRGFNDEMVFAVENSQSDEDEGITNLRQVIKNDASKDFSFVREKLPLRWLHCEEEIIKYRRNGENKMCITLNDLRELLEKGCMTKFIDGEFSSMISFFHDSGLILLPGTLLRSVLHNFMPLCAWMIKEKSQVMLLNLKE